MHVFLRLAAQARRSTPMHTRLLGNGIINPLTKRILVRTFFVSFVIFAYYDLRPKSRCTPWLLHLLQTTFLGPSRMRYRDRSSRKRAFRKDFSGVPPLHRTRWKVPGMRTAKANRSGIDSLIRLAKYGWCDRRCGLRSISSLPTGHRTSETA